MPYKEKGIVKVKYSIGAAAKVCRVSPSAIRAWEKKLPWLKPSRRNNENRYYTIKEVERIQKVNFLSNHEVSINSIGRAWDLQYFNQYIEFLSKSIQEADPSRTNKYSRTELNRLKIIPLWKH